MQVAGDGGMGEDEVVEVGVLLECWKISSSKCECPGGEVATSAWAAEKKKGEKSSATECQRKDLYNVNTRVVTERKVTPSLFRLVVDVYSENMQLYLKQTCFNVLFKLFYHICLL